MPKTPDKDLEPRLPRGRVRSFEALPVIIAIEYHQAPQARISPAPSAKVRQRAGWTTAAQDHRILLDTASQTGSGESRPTLQDLAIPGALDVENERVAGSTTRRRGIPSDATGWTS